MVKYDAINFTTCPVLTFLRRGKATLESSEFNDIFYEMTRFDRHRYMTRVILSSQFSESYVNFLDFKTSKSRQVNREVISLAAFLQHFCTQAVFK